jgi:hypothetical protein
MHTTRTSRMRQTGAVIAAFVLAAASVQITRADCQQCVGAPCCPKSDSSYPELRALPPCCIVSGAAPATERAPAIPDPPRSFALLPFVPKLLFARVQILGDTLGQTARVVHDQEIYQRKCSYLL